MLGELQMSMNGHIAVCEWKTNINMKFISSLEKREVE